MKKNITINLFGSLYAIDNDAYDLLEEYLENMKRYFSQRDDGDEIADDIEHRVAELLAEMKANGKEAVSIEDIQHIIHRIGNPEEMETEEPSETPHATEQDEKPSEVPPSAPHAKPHSQTKAAHKLYRDPDDMMLGGVLSGLCKYFGCNDPLPWRIIAVILAILSFLGTGIVYLLAWAFIPMAQTAEEKLQLNGKPVTPETLNEELMRSAQKAKNYIQSPEFKSSSRNLLDTILFIIVFCIKLGLLMLAGIFALITMIYTFVLIYASCGGLATMVSSGLFDDVDLLLFTSCYPTLWLDHWGISISFIVFFSIVLYAIIRSLIKKPSDKKLRNSTKITLTVIAVLSVAAGITFTVLTVMHYDFAGEKYDRLHNTVNGIYIKGYDRERMAERGWNILACKNCNEDGNFYRNMQSLTDPNSYFLYFKFKKGKDRNPMQVQIERGEYFPEGQYHVEAIATAPGYGAFVYAKPDSSSNIVLPIPANDHQDYGNMRHMTKEALKATTFFDIPLDDERWNEYIPNKAKDWSFIKSESFYHKGGNIKYGMSNQPSAVGSSNAIANLNQFAILRIEIVPDSTHTPAKPIN